jgi:hypothetical protein
MLLRATALLVLLAAPARAASLSAPLRSAAATGTLPRMVARCTELASVPAAPGDWGALPALAGYPQTSPAGHTVLATAWEAIWAARASLHPTAPLDLLVDAGGAAHARLPLARESGADAVMAAVLPGATGAPGGPWVLEVDGEPIRVRVEEVDGVHHLDIQAPGVAPDHAPPEGLNALLDDVPDNSGCLAWARSPVVRRGGETAEEQRVVVLTHTKATPAVWRRLAPGQKPQPGQLAPAAPRTGRLPSAVQLVMVPPAQATGQPWLQRSQLPRQLGILGALLPTSTGLRLDPGLALASFKGSSSAATLMVLPVRQDDGALPGSVDILTAVARAGGRSTRALRSVPGGHALAFGGELELGAAPGLLVIGTQSDLVLEVLAGTGQPWFDGATASELGSGVVGWVQGRPDLGGGSAQVRVAAGVLEVRARSNTASARATVLTDAVVGWLGLVEHGGLTPHGG